MECASAGFVRLTHLHGITQFVSAAYPFLVKRFLRRGQRDGLAEVRHRFTPFFEAREATGQPGEQIYVSLFPARAGLNSPFGIPILGQILAPAKLQCTRIGLHGFFETIFFFVLSAQRLEARKGLDVDPAVGLFVEQVPAVGSDDKLRLGPACQAWLQDFA